jgi:succinate-acetate transporter protein
MTGLFLIFMSLRLLYIHLAFMNMASRQIHRKLMGQQ